MKFLKLQPSDKDTCISKIKEYLVMPPPFPPYQWLFSGNCLRTTISLLLKSNTIPQ